MDDKIKGMANKTTFRSPTKYFAVRNEHFYLSKLFYKFNDSGKAARSN
jgi:hypothetical protein